MVLVAGVKVYRKFYTEAKERANGVLGLHVVRPAQKDPVDLLSDILNVSLLPSSLSNTKSERLPTCPLGSEITSLFELIDYMDSLSFFGCGIFVSPVLVLQALGIDGVRALLGMRTTIGTVKEALPPPMSLLVDSFSALQNPDVSFWLCRIIITPDSCKY